MLKKQQLIEDNMGLVYYLVSKEYPTYLQDEDIIQCGMLGLCKAAEKWDESKSKFSTFAMFCIRSEIQMEFRRRLKHKGVFSLDYEYNGDDGEITTLADCVIGDEDVPYFDMGIDLSRLNEKEKKIVELLPTGMTQVAIANRLGVTKQYVNRVVRKLRAMRGYVNED